MTYSNVKLELEFLKRECKKTGAHVKKDKNGNAFSPGITPESPAPFVVRADNDGNNERAAANGTAKKARTPPTKIIIR